MNSGCFIQTEMQQHLRQARHNLRLHEELCSRFPEDFYDWKITLLFYSALHWVRALAANRKIDIGKSHHDMERSCNPRLHGVMPISRKAWEEYSDLRNRCYNARYLGIVDEDEFMRDHAKEHCLSIPGMSYIRKYMEGKGIYPE